jgi:tetratricopeptide (TPR) repeat protein
VSTHRFLAGLFLCAWLYPQMSHAQMSQSPPFIRLPAQLPDDFEGAMAPVVPDWPQPQPPEPPAGAVSLRELEHPIAKKALRAAYEGEQFSQAHNIPKAIEKLEKAVQIDPSYRDGHCNLGVQYARAGRFADARAQFQKALDIGPPAAPIYSNLALTLIAAGKIREAQDLARKALDLDPGNQPAQRIAQAIFH